MGVIYPHRVGGYRNSLSLQKSCVGVLYVTGSWGITGIVPFTNPATHSMGGKASAAKLTPAQRKEKMRRALNARWDKVRKLKKVA